jgi:hypothetical protein
VNLAPVRVEQAHGDERRIANPNSGSKVRSEEFCLRASFWETTAVRLMLAVTLITYLLGVGIILWPTIRSTPATYLVASIGQEMPYALTWPARLARDAAIEPDTPVPGPRPPEG